MDGAAPSSTFEVTRASARLNGLLVHFCAVAAPSEISFMVSREIISPRANRLSFVLPNAISPSDLRLGDDLRKLGLAFVRLNAAQA
jgi:hypothetical protein